MPHAKSAPFGNVTPLATDERSLENVTHVADADESDIQPRFR